MKNYQLTWLSPYDGSNINAELVATDNPKDALFNFACKMMIMANGWFNALDENSIRKNIKSGNLSREHHWIEFASGEVLSIIEIVENKELLTV